MGIWNEGLRKNQEDNLRLVLGHKILNEDSSLTSLKDYICNDMPIEAVENLAILFHRIMRNSTTMEKRLLEVEKESILYKDKYIKLLEEQLDSININLKENL